MTRWESDDDIRAFCRIEIPAGVTVRLSPLGGGRHALVFGERDRLTLDLPPGGTDTIIAALRARAPASGT